MQLEEFNAKIESLKAEGSQLARDGKIEEAKAKREEIEKLSAMFDAEKEAMAEVNALNIDEKVDDVVEIQNNDLGKETKTMEKIYDATSTEFKNAYLKNLLGREMTEMENDAFTQTTTNTPAVVPSQLLDEIWDLVTGQHAILGDINVYKTGTVLEVVKHTTVVSGKAKKVSEGKANDDEQNTFVKVTLAGADFSKTVRISRAAAKMSLNAFESYITNEIALQLGEALADDTVATIIDGINAKNVIATGITYENILAALGGLKRAKDVKAYMTRATLYTKIASIKDGSGAFVFNPLNNSILGAEVRIEDSVEDGVVLFGDPKKVVYNMIEDINVTRSNSIDAPEVVFLGYARGEGALVDDLGFAKVSEA